MKNVVFPFVVVFNSPTHKLDTLTMGQKKSKGCCQQNFLMKKQSPSLVSVDNLFYKLGFAYIFSH